MCRWHRYRASPRSQARMRRNVTGFASAMSGQAKPLIVSSDPLEPIFRYPRDYVITASAPYRVTQSFASLGTRETRRKTRRLQSWFRPLRFPWTERLNRQPLVVFQSSTRLSPPSLSLSQSFAKRFSIYCTLSRFSRSSAALGAPIIRRSGKPRRTRKSEERREAFLPLILVVLSVLAFTFGGARPLRREDDSSTARSRGLLL